MIIFTYREKRTKKGHVQETHLIKSSFDKDNCHIKRVYLKPFISAVISLSLLEAENECGAEQMVKSIKTVKYFSKLLE